MSERPSRHSGSVRQSFPEGPRLSPDVSDQAALSVPGEVGLGHLLDHVSQPVFDALALLGAHGPQLIFREAQFVQHRAAHLLGGGHLGGAAELRLGRVAPSAPGSAQFLHLIVSDIEAARAELAGKGAEPSAVFHDAGGGYNRFDPAARADGPDPERRSYASFVTFNDPDDNGWVLQEITTRFPGRVDTGVTSFGSVADLAEALRRAAAAHGSTRS